MTMVVKQGFRTWSSPDPNFLSNSPISSLKTQKFLKPTSPFFAIFAGLKGTSQNASNIISAARKDNENGESQQSSLYIFSFKERMMSRLPLALLAAHAIMFDKPLQVLAETCEADNSILNMNMPLLLLVALIGATVGGLVARKRKGELQQLNEQLRQINESLRRQAKIESYAPSLSYAPVSGKLTEDEVIVDPRKPDLIPRLKNGKRFLRNQEPEKAFAEFKSALELAQNLKDPIEEKKAARGVGASLQRQGKYRDAIKYHTLVLEISQREGEDSGSTEAYGAIADCYTELGELERAAKYYDQYISRLQSD
ncbi:Protein FLUORESCENT IN BLUE LIGHT- chloroplastic [Striga hermonthica]|uniref:Protein FLUORESCENT IN BLUE LIGHT- chloroplastic n=1 Tax=Striga hermonthica TaxID=68872 RepID=A0A9N7RK60_STRHE|nr:Protein FLUORESCENT IN BLUE LIGHT- chloroplastic [Striga hermonthica]